MVNFNNYLYDIVLKLVMGLQLVLFCAVGIGVAG